jgi:hypothetical protein
VSGALYPEAEVWDVSSVPKKISRIWFGLTHYFEFDRVMWWSKLDSLVFNGASGVFLVPAAAHTEINSWPEGAPADSFGYVGAGDFLFTTLDKTASAWTYSSAPELQDSRVLPVPVSSLVYQPGTRQVLAMGKTGRVIAIGCGD